jgi:hypothetical protein
LAQASKQGEMITGRTRPGVKIMLETPLGELVSEQELEDLGRYECEICHLAVVDDEMLLCPECRENNVCLYCYENGELCKQCAARHNASTARCVGDHDLMLSVDVETCTVCGQSTHPTRR